MKILIVSPHYFPENFKITDIAEELAKENEVTVWTNIPDYPNRSFFKKDYSKIRNRVQTIKGVKIQRIWSTYRKEGILSQALNYLTFWFSSIAKARINKERFDLVINYEISPITAIESGIVVAKKQNIPCITYVLDLWPDSLLVSKRIKQKSMIFRFFKRYSKKIYLNSSYIWVSSEEFIRYLTDLGCKTTNIIYIPNFYESELESNQCEATRNLPNDKFNILFAGNIGKAQGLHKTVEIAKLAKDLNISTFRFVIIGDGSYKKELLKSVHINSLHDYFIFKPRMCLTELIPYYKEADAFFFSLIDNKVIQKTLPGKVSGYMAFGKPIITDCVGESKNVLDHYNGGVYFSDATSGLKAIQGLISKDDQNISPNMEYVRSTFSKKSVMCKIKEQINNARIGK